MTSGETSSTTAESWIGRVLSERYRILQLLGEGGMGAVYLAEHTHMRKRVALKLLHAEMSENAEVLARFEREAMAAARIEHPNVATATDFGRTPDGGFFLVLEYVEGESLRTVLNRGPLGEARALHVARQIASALSRAHDAGIVHRDLKPENVMLVQRGADPDFVKVLDFGIAKLGPETVREGDPTQPLTRVGTILGTPEYMAPEQALGEPVTPKSDLYALGVVLYEMLTGLHPFDAPDRMAVLSFHIVAPVPLMRDRAPSVDVSPVVEQVARKLLEKDAKARPENARALVAEIDAAAAAIGVDLRGGAPESSPRLPASVPSSRDVSGRPSLPQSSPAPPSAAPGSDPHLAHAATGAWSAEDSLAKTSYGEHTTDPALAKTSAPGQVMAAPTGTAAIEAALRPLVATVRALPRNVQLVLLAAPVVGFLLVLVLVLALRGPKEADAAGKQTAGGGTVETSEPQKAPPRAPEEALRTATTARDVAALEAMAKSYPEDVAVIVALATTQHALGRPADALRVARQAIEKSPNAIADDLVDVVVAIANKGKGEDVDEAFALLEGPLAARGVDALVEMAAFSSTSRGTAARTRARNSLAKPDVRAKASPQAAVLLDFRAAKDCAKKRDLLDRVKDDGDGRLLATLRSMRQTRGCGFAGLRDCWACMREDSGLEEAIAAVEKRVPAASAEAAGSATPKSAPRR